MHVCFTCSSTVRRGCCATMRDNFKTFEDHLDEGMNKIVRKMDTEMTRLEEKMEKNVAHMDRQSV